MNSNACTIQQTKKMTRISKEERIVSRKSEQNKNLYSDLISIKAENHCTTSRKMNDLIYEQTARSCNT